MRTVPALQLGPLAVWPPVVLAPMAGVTDVAFRTLCRRHGGGLYVSEMVGARALAEGDPKADLKAAFGPDEHPRSIQLHATASADAQAAVRLLVAQGRVDHIDLNFGCPAPKVTRHGGGAALPWHTRLYADIVDAAVQAAGPVPVTVKLRAGIDAEHLTFLEAGRIAADLGVAAIALHARTAEDRYGPPATWSYISALVDAVDVPVWGNGDIWEAADARRMLAETGCAAVVVGRGCLGRPWLFRDLQAAFEGQPVPLPPTLGGVVDVLTEHAGLMVVWHGAQAGLRRLRKHTGWYLQGFPVGRTLRTQLHQVDTLETLGALLSTVDRTLVFDERMRRQPRGHTTRPRRVALPHGWLNRGATAPLPAAASTPVSGG